MIPPILHQTWKDDAVPQRFAAYVESWKRHHPAWEHRLWTDADLAILVDTRYPQYRDLFHSYRQPIMRADLGRCLVLREFGGVYADLDAEAVASFVPLLDCDTPLFAYEPLSHMTLEFIRNRGFTAVVSNAVIVSPAGHPFWDYLLEFMLRCQCARNPLDATGPFVLTAAIEQAPVALAPKILPAHAFSPFDKFGNVVDRCGSTQDAVAIHHWAGTWWEPEPSNRFAAYPKQKLVTPEFAISISEAARFRCSINHAMIGDATPKKGEILIAVPVRDAADTLDRLFECLLSLRHPRDELSLAFLEGDSSDNSFEMLRAFAKVHAGAFRRIEVIKCDYGVTTPEPRWALESQRSRRSHIAKVRNELLRQALRDEDWVLWIDADMIAFPDDIVSTLLSINARIVHPNAVRVPGGPSMDLNAWVTEWKMSPGAMAPWIIDGLYQPPPGHRRLYLSDLRYRDAVRLNSVGGTMLLVDANLHRAGLLFPETPYRYLIETEGFAMAACDMGIFPVGLPNVEVVHSPR
jgi:hypothetical protein